MHFLASLLILAAMPLSRKPAIVLVHGAFADASSWSKVIPILQKDGYYVTAVQIPLTSLADDVAVTKRVVDAQKGRVVVVGHSYAGAVITDAAGGDNVKALVYVDAFAPEVDEPLASVGDKFAPPPLNKALVPDAAGFLYVDRAKVHDVFAKDLTEAEARIIAVTQKPVNSSVFGAKVTSAAWKTKPSWFIVEHRKLGPYLENQLTTRLGHKGCSVKLIFQIRPQLNPRRLST